MNSAATTSPPVANSPFRNPRRLTFSMLAWTALISRSCGGRLDGGGDALIAAAAADVAAHLAVDLVLGRVLVGGEQRGGLHDLAGLAIAHCGTLKARHAFCTGWLPCGSSPSIVVT